MSNTNVNQTKILDYLKKGVTLGKQFFKSKSIARELGLSTNEVGTNISMLIDNSENIVIEKWSYSHRTTWRVYSAKEAKERLFLERFGEALTSILVINNYGQFAHLIHRAVRDLNVDSELVKNTLGVDELLRRDPDGLILSGGPTMDRIGNCKLYVKEIDLPILGICLGHQLIAETFGGTVSKGASGGYAHIVVEIIEPDDILVDTVSYT